MSNMTKFRIGDILVDKDSEYCWKRLDENMWGCFKNNERQGSRTVDDAAVELGGIKPIRSRWTYIPVTSVTQAFFRNVLTIWIK